MSVNFVEIPMGSQIPFRLPCETTSSTPKYFFGGPFQHNLAPLLVDKFVNIATVPNPAGSGLTSRLTNAGHRIPPSPAEVRSSQLRYRPGKRALFTVDRNR